MSGLGWKQERTKRLLARWVRYPLNPYLLDLFESAPQTGQFVTRSSHACTGEKLPETKAFLVDRTNELYSGHAILRDGSA